MKKYWLPVVCLLVGGALGAIFYPSRTTTEDINRIKQEKHEVVSHLQEQLNLEIQNSSKYRRETQNRIQTLRTENTTLRQKVRETKVKIVKPDGTIHEKTVKESDTQVVSQIVTDIKQEFNEKVTSIENKWKRVHQKRVVVIKEKYENKLQEQIKRKTEVNKRNFGVSVGYTTDEHYFSSVMYDVYGPFFLDLHLEADRNFIDNSAGVGIGIRF